jgi:hypothetical protein
MRIKQVETVSYGSLSLKEEDRQQACAAMRTPVLLLPVRGFGTL